MAGGIGSRFWPVSRTDNPKQFIDVMGVGRTMLQLTFERMERICPRDHIVIVTGEQYAARVREQLPGLLPHQVLAEPLRRNTAPCIAYVAWRIKKVDPQANLVVTPSDHIVMNTEEFKRVITSALKFTAETDAIVTLGMQPTRPETGYGYIQADLASMSLRNREIYRVDSFKEKPDLKTAQEYLKQKEYYWNSGIFVWRVSTIVNAMRIYQPEIAKIFEGMFPVLGTAKEQTVVNKEFPKCPNISIDYAIMETADEIFVMPADFGWSDVGTWGSLITLADKDREGNAVIGNNVKLYESHGCMIHTVGEKRVVVQGLDNYIVAEKDNTLLICKLSEEQRIKEFSE